MKTAGNDKKLALPAFFSLSVLFFVLFFFIWSLFSDRSNTDNASPQDASMLSLSGRTMGTTYRIVLHQTDIDSADEKTAVQGKISERLHYLDKVLLSTYEPQSQLSLLNASEPDNPFTLSPELVTVLTLTQEVFTKSSGAFDVSLKPLVDLWGFGVDENSQKIPADKALQHALSQLGMTEFQITHDEGQFSIRKNREVFLDLSAVAKGFAVDQIAELLEALGLQHYLIEIGGELLIKGQRANGELWRIGIEQPEQGAPVMFQQIQNDGKKLAVASSGNYQNYFTHQGQDYSHIIDPLTGWPVQHDLASVTVVGTTTMAADAWATALFVLGLEEGMMLANDLQLAAFFIVPNKAGFDAHHSEAFIQYL